MAYSFRLPLITDLTIGQQSALNEPNAIAISGGPGTGKSVVSLWRHIRNYELGEKRSLLLTYTKTLEAYLAASAMFENIDAGVSVNRTYSWVTHADTQYDEIIIDEAQDVQESNYTILKNFAPVISYGADDKQIVDPKKCTTEAELKIIFPENIHYQLDENFRNSYEIMSFAKGLFPNKLIPHNTIVQLRDSGRTGNKPFVLLTNKDEDKQSKAIIDVINQFLSDNHNIAILVPLGKHVDKYYNIIKTAKIKCSMYRSKEDEIGTIENVHITTFKSSKGVEFDTVIMPDFNQYQWNIKNLNLAPITENDYYVGITRAKRNLYLISSTELGYIPAETYKKEQL